MQRDLRNNVEKISEHINYDKMQRDLRNNVKTFKEIWHTLSTCNVKVSEQLIDAFNHLDSDGFLRMTLEEKMNYVSTVWYLLRLNEEAMAVLKQEWYVEEKEPDINEKGNEKINHNSLRNLRHHLGHYLSSTTGNNNRDHQITSGANTGNTVWDVIKSKTAEREQKWWLSQLDHHWAMPWPITSINHSDWQWKFTVPTRDTYKTISWDDVPDYRTAEIHTNPLTWQSYASVKLQALRTAPQWSQISSSNLADQKLYTEAWKTNYMSKFAENLKEKWTDIKIMQTQRFNDLITLIQKDFWLENEYQARLAFMYMTGIPYNIRLANDNETTHNCCYLGCFDRPSGRNIPGFSAALPLLELW